MTNQLTQLRNLSPAEQIRALRGQKVEREFIVERDGLDTNKRTAWLSIASEEPYERWWGVEVLDLSAQSVRTKRLRSGAPLLVGHDAADQVGVIEAHTIGADRRLRILARFGKSARAEEIWQDVIDGIRRNTSVGYVIHDLVLERQEGDLNYYRVTDWEPFEGSLVAVPADPTVGLGRNHNPTQRKKIMEHDNDTRTRSEDREARRVQQLYAAGDTFPNNGGPALARELIASGASVESFNARMLESMRGAQRITATAQPFEIPGSSPITAAPYRGNISPILLRQFGGDRHKAEAGLYGGGQWLRAKLAGNKDAARWCLDHGVMQRDSSEGVSTEGGFLVPDVLSNSVLDFTNEFGVARQECRVVPMSSDSMQVPVRNSGVTAYFVGEADEATKSAPAWGSVGLTAKKLAVLSVMSSEVQDDAVIDLASWISMEAGRSFAEKEDNCWLNGDGTSTYGGMTGIRTKIIDGSHNAGKFTAAANHDTFPEIDGTDLGNFMATLPQQALRNAKWYCSQAFYGTVFQRLIAAAGGITLADMVSGPIRQGYLGFPIVISEKMPSGTSTDYTGLVMLLFGDMTQASLLGTRREIRIKVDGSRYLEFDQIAIMATERFHINNHQLGDNTTAGAVVGMVGA